MEDRFTRGFVAGILSGVPTNAFSFFAGAMGMTSLRTADLIGVVLYAYSPPFGYGEIVFALFGHLMVSGILGIGFAYFVPQATSRNFFLKGWIFSITVWFAVYAIGTLYRIPGTVPTSLNTSITDFASATLFGLALAFALRKLTPHTST
jgi:hypothetical protein